MDRVEGIIFRSKNGPAKDLTDTQRRTIAENLIGTMTELHNLDYVAAGLEIWGGQKIHGTSGGWLDEALHECKDG